MKGFHFSEGLKAIIRQKIKFRELRISINAMSYFPLEKLSLHAPEYGLGTIPSLECIANSNRQITLTIDDCQESIKKLLYLADYLEDGGCNDSVRFFLKDNTLDLLSFNKFKKMLLLIEHPNVC